MIDVGTSIQQRDAIVVAGLSRPCDGDGAGDEGFARLVRSGTLPQPYALQIQCYMRYDGYPRALVVAVERDAFNLWFLSVGRSDQIGGEMVVRDLGSVHGTFVNGTRISESPLMTDDILSVGMLSFFSQCSGRNVLTLESIEDLPWPVAQDLTHEESLRGSTAKARINE